MHDAREAEESGVSTIVHDGRLSESAECDSLDARYGGFFHGCGDADPVWIWRR